MGGLSAQTLAADYAEHNRFPMVSHCTWNAPQHRHIIRQAKLTYTNATQSEAVGFVCAIAAALARRLSIVFFFSYPLEMERLQINDIMDIIPPSQALPMT